MSRPPLGLVVVGALLASGVGLGGTVLGDSQPTRRAAELTPVVGITAVCPDIRNREAQVQTRVSVGAAPAPEGVAKLQGRLLGQPLNARGAPAELPVREPGQVAIGLATDLDGDAYVIDAQGPVAAGLEVEQITRGEGGAERGFAGLRCEAPKTEAWFVGGSAAVSESTLLQLANPDATNAFVDVTVFTADGPVDARQGKGILVPGRKRAPIKLEDLAPGKDLLAVHVQAKRGRVAAAMRHVRYDGRTSRGVEWVPQSQPPAREVVVPGLPSRDSAGFGRRFVYVTNPTPDDAVVSLQVTTDDGQFVPAGLEALEVPAGKTVSTEVTELMAESSAAVRITSDGAPVLAAGFVLDAQDPTQPIRDFSYAGSARPLTGLAVLTDLVIDRPTESALLLAALDGDASVEVSLVPILGQEGALPASKIIKIPGGRTQVLGLSTFFPPGAAVRLAVEVRPVAGSGPVYATRYLRERGARGPLTTILQLQGAAQEVPRPPVVRDLGAGITR